MRAFRQWEGNLSTPERTHRYMGRATPDIHTILEFLSHEYVASITRYLQVPTVMDTELQALRIMLSLPAAAIKVNSAFYNTATAYMCRRPGIIRKICS